MRTILFDWMMEVSAEFSMKRETFHYSVNYTDRYLERVHNVPKGELQLIGVTALYIASKMNKWFQSQTFYGIKNRGKFPFACPNDDQLPIRQLCAHTSEGF